MSCDLNDFAPRGAQRSRVFRRLKIVLPRSLRGLSAVFSRRSVVTAAGVIIVLAPSSLRRVAAGAAPHADQPPAIERNVFRTCSNSSHAQLIQPRDQRLQRAPSASGSARRDEQTRQRGDLSARRRRELGGRDRQPLDDRRRHMGGDPQPDEIVHDEAVEQAAEKMLIASGSGVRRQKTVCVETHRAGRTRRSA